MNELTPTSIFQMDAARRKREARRIPISGATPSDLAFARNELSIYQQLVMSGIHGTMGNINENLSSPIDINYALALIADGFKELKDALEAREG